MLVAILYFLFPPLWTPITLLLFVNIKDEPDEPGKVLIEWNKLNPHLLFILPCAKDKIPFGFWTIKESVKPLDIKNSSSWISKQLIPNSSNSWFCNLMKAISIKGSEKIKSLFLKFKTNIFFSMTKLSVIFFLYNILWFNIWLLVNNPSLNYWNQE